MRALVPVAVLAACVPPVPCPDLAPAAALVCDADPGAALGAGPMGAFVPHDPGAPFVLVRGEQGLQHVELDVRLDLDPAIWAVDRALVDVGAWRLDDALAVAPLDSWGVGLVADGDATRVRGLRWVVPDRTAAIGARVVLAVRVSPVGLDAAYAAWGEGDVVAE